MPSGGVSVSVRCASSSPTLVIQWQNPILFPWCKMVREELSGAVSIFCQTSVAGTALPAELRPAYSARQSRTFMTSQNRVIRTKARRESMTECSNSLNRKIERLADAQAPIIQARIGSHQGSDFHAVFSGNHAGGFA